MKFDSSSYCDHLLLIKFLLVLLLSSFLNVFFVESKIISNSRNQGINNNLLTTMENNHNRNYYGHDNDENQLYHPDRLEKLDFPTDEQWEKDILTRVNQNSDKSTTTSSDEYEKDDAALLEGLAEFEAWSKSKKPSNLEDSYPIVFHNRKMDEQLEDDVADFSLISGKHGCPTGTRQSPNGQCVRRVRV